MNVSKVLPDPPFPRVCVDQVLIGIDVTLDHMPADKMEPMLEQLVERAEAAIVGAPIPPR